jgi:hypothetical protein
MPGLGGQACKVTSLQGGQWIGSGRSNYPPPVARRERMRRVRGEGVLRVPVRWRAAPRTVDPADQVARRYNEATATMELHAAMNN